MDASNEENYLEVLEQLFQLRSSPWQRAAIGAIRWDYALQLAERRNNEYVQAIDDTANWFKKIEHLLKEAKLINHGEDLNISKRKQQMMKDLCATIVSVESGVISLQDGAAELVDGTRAPEQGLTAITHLTDLLLTLQGVHVITSQVYQLIQLSISDTNELDETPRSDHATTPPVTSGITGEIPPLRIDGDDEKEKKIGVLDCIKSIIKIVIPLVAFAFTLSGLKEIIFPTEDAVPQ